MNAIVACDRNYGIGYQGKLPWSFKDDMKHFKTTTMGSIVIMGYNTWVSINIPDGLPGRINIVLTRKKEVSLGDKVLVFPTPESIIQHIIHNKLYEYDIFVIGGEQVYTAFQPWIQKIYCTHIDEVYECDVHFPIDWALYTDKHVDTRKHLHRKRKAAIKRQAEQGIDIQTNKQTNEQDEKSILTYKVHVRKNTEEADWLDMVNNILTNGETRIDRTSIGTISLFAPQLPKFDLSNNQFPLQTLRKTFFRGIVEELLWFIRGSTNTKELADKGVNIWNPNASRETLDKLGLTEYKEGDIGPGYGFQWRHFGAEYRGCHTTYADNEGFDQLQYIINEIKTNPTSRRIFMSAWAPNMMNKMVLPPCHVSYQFYVSSRTNQLSCYMYQRSSDVFLASYWNIASAALLTIMLAHYTSLSPGSLTVAVGDAHLYTNHIAQVHELLQRSPYSKPYLFIKCSPPDDIKKYTADDFILLGYEYGEPISGSLNV